MGHPLSTQFGVGLLPKPSQNKRGHRGHNGGMKMGSNVFKLPDIGEGVVEGEITAWHVAVGDTVVEDQEMVDIMTD